MEKSRPNNHAENHPAIQRLRQHLREYEEQGGNKLSSMGWHSITIWECELKPNKKDATLQSLVYTLSKIFLLNHQVRRYELPEEETPMMVADNNELEYGKTQDIRSEQLAQ